MNQSAYNVISRQANKYSAMSDGRYEACELVNVAVAGGAGAVSALSFISTIARCRIIDFLRIENKVANRFKTNYELDSPAKGNDFVKIDASMDIMVLQNAAGLSQTEAAVIRMRYIEGLSFKGMARKLGYANKASSWVIHNQAIKKIRSILRN